MVNARTWYALLRCLLQSTAHFSSKCADCCATLSVLLLLLMSTKTRAWSCWFSRDTPPSNPIQSLQSSLYRLCLERTATPATTDNDNTKRMKNWSCLPTCKIFRRRLERGVGKPELDITPGNKLRCRRRKRGQGYWKTRSRQRSIEEERRCLRLGLDGIRSVALPCREPSSSSSK